MRLKQGFIRDDGKVFSQYFKRNGVEKEMWYSYDVFQKIKKKRIARNIDRQKRNREKHSKSVMEWRKRNPGKASKSSRESSVLWRKRNPEKSKIKSTISNFKRRSIKANQLHPEHDQSKEMQLVKIAKSLSLQVDHIIPLSRGGWHWHENLRLLPKSLNSSKNNRLDSELPLNHQYDIEFWNSVTKFYLHFPLDAI